MCAAHNNNQLKRDVLSLFRRWNENGPTNIIVPGQVLRHYEAGSKIGKIDESVLADFEFSLEFFMGQLFFGHAEKDSRIARFFDQADYCRR